MNKLSIYHVVNTKVDRLCHWDVVAEAVEIAESEVQAINLFNQGQEFPVAKDKLKITLIGVAQVGETSPREVCVDFLEP